MWVKDIFMGTKTSKESEERKQDLIAGLDIKGKRENSDLFSVSYVDSLSPDQIMDKYEQVDGQAFIIKCRLLASLRKKFLSDPLFGQYLNNLRNDPIHPMKLGSQPRLNKLAATGKFCIEHNISDLSKTGILQSAIVELARPKYKVFAGSVFHEIKHRNLPLKTIQSLIDKELAVTTAQSQLKDSHQSEENEDKQEQENDRILIEKELYPKLQEYLKHEFGLFCRRIEEGSSTNPDGKGGNHWLHPDIVAIEDPKGSSNVRLWSFEVKTELNTSNARKSFFQALANSGWAYKGYLVAPVINEKVREDLKMLSEQYGIGVIQLDAKIPSQSKQYPHCDAKKNEKDNWTAVERLRINRDFDEFMTIVDQCRAAKCIVNESYWNDFLMKN